MFLTTFKATVLMTSFSMPLDDKPVLSKQPHPQETYKQASRPMTRRRMDELKGPHGPKFNVMVTWTGSTCTPRSENSRARVPGQR